MSASQRNAAVLAVLVLACCLAAWFTFGKNTNRLNPATTLPGPQTAAHKPNRELQGTLSLPQLSHQVQAAPATPAPEATTKPNERKIAAVETEVELRFLNAATKEPIRNLAITVRPFHMTDLPLFAAMQFAPGEEAKLAAKARQLQNALEPVNKRTNGQGRLRLFNLPPGEFLIELQARNMLITTRAQLRIDESGNRTSPGQILVYPTVTVRGQLVDSKTYTGIRNARVQTHHSNGSLFGSKQKAEYELDLPMFSARQFSSTSANARGKFEFSNLLPDREYQLTLGGGDHIFIEQTITTPAIGGTLNLGQIPIPAGIEVNLELVNTMGEPLPDRPIIIAQIRPGDEAKDGTRVKESASDWLTLPLRTDSAGTASSHAFAPGTWALISTNANGKETEIDRFTLAPGSQARLIRTVWR